MLPESLEALKFICASSKAPTPKTFNEHFAPNGEALLNTILNSHVELVKGKLVPTQAGEAVMKWLKENEVK